MYIHIIYISGVIVKETERDYLPVAMAPSPLVYFYTSRKIKIPQTNVPRCSTTFPRTSPSSGPPGETLETRVFRTTRRNSFIIIVPRRPRHRGHFCINGGDLRTFPLQQFDIVIILYHTFLS